MQPCGELTRVLMTSQTEEYKHFDKTDELNINSNNSPLIESDYKLWCCMCVYVYIYSMYNMCGSIFVSLLFNFF